MHEKLRVHIPLSTLELYRKTTALKFSHFCWNLNNVRHMNLVGLHVTPFRHDEAIKSGEISDGFKEVVTMEYGGFAPSTKIMVFVFRQSHS